MNSVVTLLANAYSYQLAAGTGPSGVDPKKSIMANQLLRPKVFFLVLAAFCLVLFGVNLSSNLSHTHYVWSDAGSGIHSAKLVAEGKVPWVDFSYNYGCASLWLSVGWLSCFGYTPIAYLALNIVCTFLICWGITRLVTFLQWPLLIRLFVIACVPFQFGFVTHNTAASVEIVLLIHFVVEFLKRRYAIALVLATMTLFFKPGLAYFAGFILLLDMLRNRNGQTIPDLLKTLGKNILPALAVFMFYSILVSSIWGVTVLIESLFPFSAMMSYKEYHFGFFGQGRSFWFPEKENIWYLLRYYLFSSAGIWIAGSLYLFFQLAKTLIVWWGGGSITLQHRCILICGLLLLSFLAFLIAGPWSFGYTYYLVVFGVAAGLNLHYQFSIFRFMAILVFMALGFGSTFRSVYTSWKMNQMSVEFHYLFMPVSFQKEYESIQDLAAHHRLLVLHGEGAASLLLKHAEMPPVWMLLYGTMLESELKAIFEQIDSAEVVVVLDPPAGMTNLQTIQAISERLKRFDVRKKSEHFIYMTTKSLESELGKLVP
jgi:hypothetical protein